MFSWTMIRMNCLIEENEWYHLDSKLEYRLKRDLSITRQTNHDLLFSNLAFQQRMNYDGQNHLHENLYSTSRNAHNASEIARVGHSLSIRRVKAQMAIRVGFRCATLVIDNNVHSLT